MNIIEYIRTRSISNNLSSIPKIKWNAKNSIQFLSGTESNTNNMNWKNYSLLALIIIVTLADISVVRGGKGGGGRGGGRRGGGGGMFSGLFAGNTKKSSPPSHPVHSSNRAPVHNSMPYHTSNYGRTFSSGPSRNSDPTDFLNGLKAGGHMSLDLLRRHSEIFPTLHQNMQSPAESAGNISPRLLVINNNNNNNQAEITATETTETKKDPFDILNELSKPIGENESMASFLDRISKIDLRSLMQETSAKVAELNSRIEEQSKTVEENQTGEETTIKATDTSTPIAETSPVNVESTTVTPPLQSQVVITESTLESRTDVSAPYGVICAPMLYNEINEFGVNVTIERVACYPAPEPIVEGAAVNMHD